MDLYNTLRKTKILIIDDDEWIRDSLFLFFENEGCQLSALETAEEAMGLPDLKSFGVIIVDYRLPGMDGLKFLKHIQKSGKNIIKILITAYNTDEIISKAKALDVGDIINKPFTAEALELSLSRLLFKQPSGRPGVNV